MKYVLLNEEQSKKISSKSKGYGSIRKEGVKHDVVFCSSLEFSKAFGHDVKKIFVEI